jgi:hypothetical protein
MLSALNYSDDGGALVGAFEESFFIGKFQKMLQKSRKTSEDLKRQKFSET